MNAKKLTVALIAVVLATAGLGAAWLFQERDPPLIVPGTVEIQEVRLGSKIGGRVKLVHISEGAIASPGQALVTLDVPEWHAKRGQMAAQVAMAKAQIDRARNGALPEEKASARATWEMAKVRLARLKNGNRAEEIDAAQMDWKALQAEEERAQKEWAREVSLSQKRASSAAQTEAALATFQRLQSQTKAAGERFRLLNKGARPEDIAEAETDVAKTRANFELLERGTRAETIAEAEAHIADMTARLQEIDAMLAEATVLAPSRSLVEVVSVRPGDTVPANQPIVRILNADDLWVKAYVSEPDLGHVRIGLEVTVTNDTFPGKKCKGVVSYIASASEFTPRNVQSPDERRNQVFAIKVRLLESADVFKSGMAAEVRIPRMPAKSATTQPNS